MKVKVGKGVALGNHTITINATGARTAAYDSGHTRRPQLSKSELGSAARISKGVLRILRNAEAGIIC